MDMFKQGKSELLLVIGVIAILMLLFTPVPAVALDLLLLTNFCLALIILLLTFYTDKPLSFSTFPSLILIATLFRLGLNVSSTRLILNDAAAGQVIASIGSHVVGGNYVIGLVVFLILIVVQYVVVTNGAQRVAEVAARFTLDSMPGKQMSIDADLNMGLIDEHDAKARRLEIEKEANFYGAMDGSTKFVKGDAIAGIIIILINIIGGLSIGTGQMGMEWGTALHTYTLLTVGDGIVTQIPSLIIATATGIIITRAASDAQLGKELAAQITSHPRVLVIIVVTLLLVLFMPGLPALPILFLAFLIGFMAFFSIRRDVTEKESVNDSGHESQYEDPLSKDVVESTRQEDLYRLTHIEQLELRVGTDIYSYINGESCTLNERLANFRKQFALDYGLVIPVHSVIQDRGMTGNHYRLLIHGAKVASGEIHPDLMLAIDPTGKKQGIAGIKTKEPTYGLPALWVETTLADPARKAGFTVVDPETTFLTHITETLKKYSPEFLTRSETEKLLSRVAEQQHGLVDELIPSVLSYSDVQKVLQQLLQEKVSIRNLPLILEELVDAARQEKNIVFLTEKVRFRLRNQISQGLADGEASLNVLTFEPRLEQRLVAGVGDASDSNSLMLDGDVTETLLRSLSTYVERMLSKRLTPVLLCTPILRRKLYLFCERALPQLHVLSLNEIPTTVNVRSFGMIRENGEVVSNA
ncbi:FHIPEP family type III secretion protein [Paraneptunicella aestuarii]|uniref:flagellar biosynthesis protein FlhA n=1 Tax=Paraneptunicella aestuarii TaxID=2831148 RepID=UPI001E5B7361|nr:flagellar biosynthesis protein FlhA [Paraneptunicella aestuarii]UAA37601.1 FHIPEP family type III secretion protein [Paraneptunicella aestuarii]